MRRDGGDSDRAPREALDLVIDAGTPVEDHPALTERRKQRSRRRCGKFMA
jgi:hypothetical protein